MASETSSSVSILRATIASALTFGILYAFCWAGIGLNVPVTHMFVSFFTTQPIETIPALLNGLCLSVPFGAMFGFLISFLYNVLPLGGR